MTNAGESEGIMRPILLVGAGRSGTNLVSMALGASNSLHNVYEQRYIWTKGARDAGSDLRSREDATPEVINYIRRHFARQSRHLGRHVRLIDKTPANALRLPFCLKVFPEAKIINIVRNPYDNIASRLVELQKAGYELEGGDATDLHPNRRSIIAHRTSHARELIRRGNLPLDRIPAAVVDQLWEQWRILLYGRSSRYAERVPGIREIANALGPMAALCHQWRELVLSAVRDGRRLGSDRYLELQYEHIIFEPKSAGEQLSQFVALNDPGRVIEYLVANARANTVGNWRRRLKVGQIREITETLYMEMELLGIDSVGEDISCNGGQAK